MNISQKVQLIKVDAEVGQRLDNFLARRLKGVPKSRLYRLIRKGEVRINGKRSQPDSRLEAGDEVRIPPVRVQVSEIPKPSDNLAKILRRSVIADTGDFLVLNKPAGMSVHGGSGVRLGLIEALRQLKPDWKSLELAHRLDRDTSGCLVLALSPAALKYFHSQLREKRVRKDYLALVAGYWPDSLREVDAALRKNQLLSGERMVKAAEDGKPSLTRFQVLDHFGKSATLIKATPVTGRTHQIRVHCFVSGHPILGDVKYGPRELKPWMEPITGLCLHAAEIAFKSPYSTEELLFRAEPSPLFNEAVSLLKSR